MITAGHSGLAAVGSTWRQPQPSDAQHGGTMYVDGGKPAPGLIDQTVVTLKKFHQLSVTMPRGFDMLLPYLEKDFDLRGNFLKFRCPVLCGCALRVHGRGWKRSPRRRWPTGYDVGWLGRAEQHGLYSRSLAY